MILLYKPNTHQSLNNIEKIVEKPYLFLKAQKHWEFHSTIFYHQIEFPEITKDISGAELFFKCLGDSINFLFVGRIDWNKKIIIIIFGSLFCERYFPILHSKLLKSAVVTSTKTKIY